MIFQLTTHIIKSIFNASEAEEGGHQLWIYRRKGQECFHPASSTAQGDQLPWLVTHFLLCRPFLLIQTMAWAKRPFGLDAESYQLRPSKTSV